MMKKMSKVEFIAFMNERLNNEEVMVERDTSREEFISEINEEIKSGKDIILHTMIH